MSWITRQTRKRDRHLRCKMTGICGATRQTLYTFGLERFSQLLSGLQWLHCFERSFALWLKIEMLHLFYQIWNDPHCQKYNLRWLSICCNPPDLIGTDIFSCCGYKLKIWELFSLVRLKIMGGLEWSGDDSHFFVWASEENGSGHQVPMQHFPHHLHCYELFVCGMLKRAEMETPLWLPEDVWISLSLSLVSLLCVCVSAFVSVCWEKLWQTKLDSVGGVNSITFFFFFFFIAAHFWIWFSPSSKASQMDTYQKRCFAHVRLNIYMCSTDACLTGMYRPAYAR